MTLTPEQETAIHEEEAVLRTVVDSLKKQSKDCEAGLREENYRARELTSGIVATRRVEDKALLASDEAVSYALRDKKLGDTKVLSKLIEKPYFARVVLEESNERGVKQIEYKIGTAANPDCRIIDWRKAPISKLYYDYREGDEYAEEIQGMQREGKVLLRNSVEIDKSDLKRFTSRHGTFAKSGDHWIRSEPGTKHQATPGTLAPILSLITPDQFRTITEDAKTAVLIQGVAGSGKTTVALHRLAWLLHESNSDLSVDECVVLVLSPPLKAYIAATLPSMEVEGVRILTLREWCAELISRFAGHLITENGTVRRAHQRPGSSIERLKRSLAALKVLEQQCALEREKVIAQVAATFPWDNLPSGLRKLFDERSASNTPILRLLTDLSDGISSALSLVPPSHPRAAALIPMQHLVEEYIKEASRFEDNMTAILDKPQPILDADETKLLSKDIIDAARIRARENQELGVLDECDEMLLLRLYEMKWGGIPLPSRNAGTYRHIVADEVQDLSPVDIAAVFGAVKEVTGLTLVGDTAQHMSDTHTFSGWEKLRKHGAFKDAMSTFVTLSVSHRSTLPIMKFAAAIQGESPVREGRNGRVPIWFKADHESLGMESALKWIGTAVERYPDAVTAVICRDHADAKLALSFLSPTFGASVRLWDEGTFSFDEGVIVTHVAQVKGLEFKNVILWNPSAKHYPNDALHRNMLYVACTRAEENLCIATWSPPSPLLPPFLSPLVRAVPLEPENEDE